MIPLNEVLTRHDDWISLDPDTDYRQITVRLWGKGLAQRAIVKGSTIAAATQNRVKTGQFLISKIDARHGAFGLVPAELNGAVVSGDFPSFDVNADRALSGLINWISKTDWFIALCKRASEGSTNRVRLKEDRFLNQEIPLPPIKIQRRIVAQLDGVAHRIDQVRAISAGIDTDISALIVSANASCANGAPIPLGEALELAEDQVAVIPGEEYPQIGIRGFGGGLFAKPPVRAEDTTYRHFNRLHEGQFVMSQVKGWEGAVAVCSAEHVSFFASPEYRTFNCRPDRLRPSYFSYLCRTPWFHERLSGLTRGVGARRERLRPEMLMNLEIPLPNTTAQARFEHIFRLSETAQRCAAVSELEHLLPALLDRAFSGDTSQQQAA